MHRSIVTLGLVVLLGGCSAAQDPRREDLTAEQHEREAAREDEEARSHRDEYDPGARALIGARVANPSLGTGPEVYNPTERHLGEADEHRDHASAHRARAAALRAFEAQACRGLTDAEREACPLLLGLASVEDVPGGVRLTFAPDQEIGPVIEQLRCHVAFAAARGRDGIEECALYVHGAELEVHGRTVMLTTAEREHVEELRRRARTQAP
jgi:hypothetical protein